MGHWTLALCAGLRSYHAFSGIADCTVRDCMNQEGDDAHFFNLNMVNGFHGFIKKRYDFYRGMNSMGVFKAITCIEEFQVEFES